MNNKAIPSTIAELFDNWQEGRTFEGCIIKSLARYNSTLAGMYHVEFLFSPPIVRKLSGLFTLDPIPAQVEMMPPKLDRLLTAARALVDNLPASRVWTQEEIALVYAVAALTDPEPMPFIEQLTKERARALGFGVKPFTVEDSATGESVQYWYLERNNEFYLYGIKIDTCTVDVLRYHCDLFDTIAESAWRHLPMIDNRTGVIINRPYYSTNQQPTK